MTVSLCRLAWRVCLRDIFHQAGSRSGGLAELRATLATLKSSELAEVTHAVASEVSDLSWRSREDMDDTTAALQEMVLGYRLSSSALAWKSRSLQQLRSILQRVVSRDGHLAFRAACLTQHIRRTFGMTTSCWRCSVARRSVLLGARLCAGPYTMSSVDVTVRPCRLMLTHLEESRCWHGWRLQSSLKGA